MKFYDLLHPASGQPYRLASRVLMIPGFPEVRERVLVPMLVSTNGEVLPFVTADQPIITALPTEPHLRTVGDTRFKLMVQGWKPAD